MQDQEIKYISQGALSKKEIQLIFRKVDSQGISFKFVDQSSIEASVKNLVSAQRNTVLGNANNSVCFVEHLLAVINLLHLDSLEIEVHGQEIPLEDGSGRVWQELLAKTFTSAPSNKKIILDKPISYTDDKNRSIVAFPAEKFKMSYLFIDPVSKQKKWVSWEDGDDPSLLIDARTFATAFENELMGLKGKVLSYDANGFDLEFRYEDEPIYHKLLDLFGDLSLSTINPLNIKAHFISFTGSHSINVEMAGLINSLL